MITSMKNQIVKDAVKLRNRRRRKQDGLFLIDGVREIARALQAGIRLKTIFYDPLLCDTDESVDLLNDLETKGANLLEVSSLVYSNLAFGERLEGVVAVAETPASFLADLKLSDDPLVVVLESVEKPGNIGAVLRSADAVGCDAVIVADGGTDLYNPNVIRASLGTIFAQPVVAATTNETLAWLREKKLAIFAARVEGSVLYTQVDFRVPAAIVLGSEARGLSEAWEGPDVTAIHLPMNGVADSLNVSVATAVLLYEALRQRS